MRQPPSSEFSDTDTDRIDPSVSVSDERWQELWPNYDEDVHSLCRVIDKSIALPSTLFDVSITLTSDTEIRTLNHQYRNIDKPTNVLAFPQHDAVPAYAEGACLLGDVIVAFETVRQEALDHQTPFIDYAQHMIAHGILHLLGYDHMDEREASVMENLEIAILRQIGVANPYAHTCA